MSTPDFSKIFAQNATSVQEWIDAARLIGWGNLGQELPPYELFDALQRNTDLKMKWLYDNLAKSQIVQRETEYVVGDVTWAEGLNSWEQLECIVATSATAAESSKPDFSTYSVDDEIVDGGVTWKVTDKRVHGITADTISSKLMSYGGLLSMLSSLKNNIDVNWDGDEFDCPSLGTHGLIAQNGYIKLGDFFGGLIIQWGNGSTNSNGDVSVVFPISFKNDPKIALASIVAVSQTHICSRRTASNFYVQSYNTSTDIAR